MLLVGYRRRVRRHWMLCLRSARRQDQRAVSGVFSPATIPACPRQSLLARRRLSGEHFPAQAALRRVWLFPV